MSVKSVLFKGLLMLLITVTQVTACDEESMDYKCTQLQAISCSNNPRIRVVKSDMLYQLVILCDSNQCSENITIRFECCDICEACGILADKECAPGVKNQQQRKAECERQLDNIFNSYCSSTTSATIPAFSESTVPVTLSVLTNSSRASASDSDRVNSTTPGLVIALGVLLCLSVLLLAMVTIGWVCTCLIVKKRYANKSAAALKCTTNEEEIYLKNPTYYDRRASSANAPAVVGYDIIANCPSQARIGQTYNVLSRGQVTGPTTAMHMAAPTTAGDGNYSQLGSCDGEHGNK